MMSRSKGRQGRAFRRCFIAASLLLAVACGKTKTVDEYLRDAEIHRKSGNISAAIIDLKNALQQDNKNATARLFLGRLYLDIPDGASAAAELLRARQDNADPVAVSRALAEANLILGKPEAALKETDITSVTSSADRASLLGLRGRALLTLGRLPESRAVLEQGLQADAHSIDVLSAMVWYALANGDVAMANERLAVAQKEDPNSATLFALRGAVAFVNRDFPASEEAYEKMRASVPWNLSARLGMARAELAQDKIKEAEANLAVVLKAAPNDPNANYLRALAAYREKDYLLAQSHIDRTLNGARDFAPAILLAGATSYALKQYEQASSYLGQYVYRVPQNAQARKLLAAVQFALGHSADAVKTLSAVAQGSDDAELLGMIGVASAQSGDLSGANRYLNEAVKRQPDNAELRAQLGIAQVALGQTDAGVEELERASQQDPGALRPEIALFVTYLHSKEFDKALGVGERLQKSHPADAIGFDFSGLALSAKNEEQKAHEKFDKARELHAGDSIANRSLAAFAIRSGDYRTAEKYYQEIVDANSNDVRAFIDLVTLQAKENRASDVHATLDKAILANPEDTALRGLLGRVLLSEGKAREALKSIEPLLAKHPTDPSLLEVSGRAQIALGDGEAAITTFKTLVGVSPHVSATHRYLAEAYLNSQKADLALAEAKASVEADSSDAAARITLARAYMAGGKYDEARRVVDDLAAQSPQDAGVADVQGGVYMAQKHVAEAIGAYRRAISLSDSSVYRIHLASALGQAGDLSGAEKTLDEWITLHSDDPAARLALGDTYLRQKRNGEALAQYTAVLTLFPDSAVAENNVAWVLSLQGKAEEAVGHARHAVALAPDAAQVLDTYGTVLLQNQRPAEAAEILAKAARGAPAASEIQLHFAQALAAAGNKQKAREVLLGLVSSPQASDERDQARKLLDKLGS